MARKVRRKKEEIAEDYCFSCKEGGLLMVCEYKNCLKAYHPHCVGRDDSFVETGDRWTCDWHSCFMCKKTSKFHCFCCPKAVCGRCICDAEFAYIRGKKGFCNHCLKLALLIEEHTDVDSDGVKIDFSDKETYEGLFKEYWEILKEKKGLTSQHVHSADKILKKNKNYRGGIESIDEWEEDDSESEEESHIIVSDYDDLNDTVENKAVGKRKRSAGKRSVIKRKVNSNKKEFIGWGSRPLLEFLASIGKETTKELSEHDLTTIITDYCRDNKLFDPEKKRKVLCDARLKSLFRRKTVNKNSIHNLLASHLAENFDQSSGEDEVGCSSEEKDGNVLVTCKRLRKLSSDRESQKELVPVRQQSCFASIVSENIKLVYLKRSLVEDLLKQPETFEVKVIGSFVRVKSDPNDYLQKNTHQLLQVTGIRRTSSNSEMNADVLLQVSNRPKDVPICKLSDDDFSKEECEDLHQRVKDGLLRQPTVVGLEQKARSLHEDIAKHWIVRELVSLQRRIDLANEKGWRRELSGYMEKKLLLETPSERSRLLHEVPVVIADVLEIDPTFEDSLREDKRGHNGLSALGTSKFPSNDIKGNGTACHPNGGTDSAAVVVPVKRSHLGAPTTEEERQRSEGSFSEESPKQIHIVASEVKDDDILENTKEEEKQQSEQSFSEESPTQIHIVAPEVKDDDILARDHHRSVLEVQQLHSKALLPETMLQNSLTFTAESQSVVVPQKMQQYSCSDTGGIRQNQTIGVQKTNQNKQSTLTPKFIELSDDEQDVSHKCLIWHCVGPYGEKRGPLSMDSLKRWSETSSYASNFRVWKTGQNQEDAIFLTDAIRQNFP